MKKKSYEDPDALPHFHINLDSKLIDAHDPFLSIKSPHKFQLLVQFILSYLEAKPMQVAEKKSENRCISEVVAMISSLASFGFISTIFDVKPVVEKVLQVLDGRSDLMIVEKEESKEEKKESMQFSLNDALALGGSGVSSATSLITAPLRLLGSRYGKGAALEQEQDDSAILSVIKEIKDIERY